jgi:transcriptional regulator with XRE-family HTH domain
LNHGDRIKDLREVFGMTQKELAKELNDLSKEKGFKVKIYPQTVSYWENGREPNFESLVLLKEYFHVSVEYIMGITDNGGIEKYLIDKTVSAEKNSKNNLLKKIDTLPDSLHSQLYKIVIDFYDFCGVKTDTVESELYNFVLIAEIASLAKDMFESVLFNQLKMSEDGYEDMKNNYPEKMTIFYNKVLCKYEVEIKKIINKLFEFSMETLSCISRNEEREQEFERQRLLKEIDNYLDNKDIQTSYFLLEEFKDRHSK